MNMQTHSMSWTMTFRHSFIQ